ncbi:hypothetical protein ABG768_017940 [Culter alburnus]|uniref:Uncharacterized protein n=1 Tax=Culter alburnus TaxID=194366 RepID=A0AAW1YTA9_CULAL
MMHCEVPKSTSCQQLLTHFSKSEPNGHGPGRPTTPSSRHSMGSVFGLFQRGKQNGRDPALFGASESGSSKAQLKVFEYLASLPSEAEEGRGGEAGDPCRPLFLLAQKSDPEEPFTFMSD